VCDEWLIDEKMIWLAGYVVAVVTLHVNHFLISFVNGNIPHLHFLTKTSETIANTIVKFIVTFFNTALISLLETAAFEDNDLMANIFDSDGETDFNVHWYAVCGRGLMLNVIL